MELVDSLNNRVYIKHSLSKGDERTASHSCSAHALLKGTGKGEKKDKKGRHMTGFFFFLSLEICGSVLMFVEYRGGIKWRVAAV